MRAPSRMAKQGKVKNWFDEKGFDLGCSIDATDLVLGGALNLLRLRVSPEIYFAVLFGCWPKPGHLVWIRGVNIWVR